MANLQVLEGTWDKVALHADELRRGNKRLRIEVIGDGSESINPEGDGESLADALLGYIGALHSGGADRLSENCGDRFTDYLVEKRKSGTL